VSSARWASQSVLDSVTFRVSAAVAFGAASVATYAIYYVEPPRSDALIISWFVALVALHFLAGALVGWWALLLPVAIAVLLRVVYGESGPELPSDSWADYFLVSVVLFPVLVFGATTRWAVRAVMKRRRASMGMH
jgi:hypothetical protein